VILGLRVPLSDLNFRADIRFWGSSAGIIVEMKVRSYLWKLGAGWSVRRFAFASSNIPPSFS